MKDRKQATTKTPHNNPTRFNRTICVVMLLISFLTFWSLALSSFEQGSRPETLIRTAVNPGLGLEHLMTRK